ncbi:MAG: MFS transporter [bacterium]
MAPPQGRLGQRQGRAGPLGRFSWAMFDWANQPYFTLIGSFIFIPYFKDVIVGDPVRGQEILAYTFAAGGLAVALVSPVLGAVADRTGRRKPWLAILSLVYMAAVAALWWAEPGALQGIWPIVLALITAAVAIEVATVFNNAMLPDIVEDRHLGFWSGFGFALGYAGALAALLGLVAAFIGPATPMIAALNLPFLAEKPLLGVEAEAYEHVRVIGPASALWYLVFVLPLFLFTPDRPSSGIRFRQAIRLGLKDLARTAAQVARYRNVALFLVARLFYNDGLAAAYAFGAAYGATTFGWGAMETAVFALIALVLAGAGAVIGGWLDDRLGAKAVLFLALTCLLLGVTGAISAAPGRVLFVIPVPATNPDGFLASTSEWFYLACGVLVGIGGGPAQAASRSMMGRISPRDQMTEFFGFYAFSGKATVFLGPLLIGVVTGLAGSDRAGVAVVAGLLLIGFLLLVPVKETRAGESVP